MARSSIFIDPSFEGQLIALIVRGSAPDICTMVPYLRPSYFVKADNAAIINAIVELRSMLGCIATIPVIRDYIQKNETGTGKVDALNTLSAIDEDMMEGRNVFEPSDMQYIFGEVKNFITKGRMIDALKGSVEDIAKGDFQRVFGRIREAEMVGALGDTGMAYLDKSQHRLQRKETFGTGYAFFDAALGGGFTRGSLVTIFGRQKMRKSFMAQNLVFKQLMLRHKSLYISFELNMHMIKERFDSLLTGAPMNLPPQCQESHQQEVDKYLDALSSSDFNMPMDSLFLKYYPAMTASISDVRAYIDLLKARYGFVPDLIVLDYISPFLMLPSGKVMDNNPYIAEIHMFAEARALASYVHPEPCVLTLAQMKKFNEHSSQGYDPTKIEGELGGSVGIGQLSDAVFVITQNQSQEQGNMIQINNLYSRFAKDRGQGASTTLSYSGNMAELSEISNS